MTGIEWTEQTWNPTTGCDRVSPGCDHCYALTMAKRLQGMGQPKYQTDGDPRTSGPGFGLATHADVLSLPFSWRKPRRVFVNSMSDLFHDEVPDAFIARVFAVMAATPDHTYQVLTKRHGRLRSVVGRGHLGGEGFPDAVEEAMAEWTHAGLDVWPLPNVWLGVSVENQQWADIRIPALADTPAAVRWLSCEPLLGPVDLHPWLVDHGEAGRSGGIPLDWVVVGGESGPGARVMEPAWAETLRDQCTGAGVPFFFKQWGEWVAPDHMPEATFMSWDVQNGTGAYDRAAPWRVGKKRAGRELDGRAWNEYPAPRARTDDSPASAGPTRKAEA